MGAILKHTRAAGHDPTGDYDGIRQTVYERVRCDNAITDRAAVNIDRAINATVVVIIVSVSLRPFGLNTSIYL